MSFGDVMDDILVEIDSLGKILWSTAANLFPESAISSSRQDKIFDAFVDDRQSAKFSRWILAAERTSGVQFRLILKSSHELLVARTFSCGKQLFVALTPASKPKSIDYWKTFTTSFGGGILFVSDTLVIQELSQATFTVLDLCDRSGIRLSKESVVDRSLYFFDYLPGIKAVINLIESRSKDDSFRESEVKVADRWLKFSIHTFAKACDSVNSFYVLVTDITETVMQRDTIEKQNHSLIVQNKLSMIGRLAGNISHEINTPLASIKIRISQLKRSVARIENLGADINDMKKSLSAIEEDTDYMSGVIASLLSYTKSGYIHREKVSLCRTINSVLTMMQEKIRSEGIQLTKSVLIPCAQDVFCIDRVSLIQVVSNLLINAIDASSAQSERRIAIEVGIEVDSGYIAISNLGSLIPEEICDKIFEPFFTTKDIGEGTGLGLSISQQILHSANGKLILDQSAGYPKFIAKIPLQIHAPRQLPIAVPQD